MEDSSFHADDCHTSQNGSPDTTPNSKELLSNGLEVFSPLSGPLKKNIVTRNRFTFSDVFLSSFQKLDVHLDDEIVDELQPPESRMLLPVQTSSHLSFRYRDCVPKILWHSVLTICRQKIHENVLREVRLFIDGTIKKHLTAWYSMKKSTKSGDCQVTATCVFLLLSIAKLSSEGCSAQLILHKFFSGFKDQDRPKETQ